MTKQNKKIDNNRQQIASPCVRNCCLNENDICLGCFRNINEIVGWANASREEKEAVLLDCQQRRILLK